MVMLQIHGCVHMLCTWHGRLLSAQTESKMNFPCCFILKDPILLYAVTDDNCGETSGAPIVGADRWLQL